MDADIRNWPREEDYIIYLARRRVGDPIPQGVFPKNPHRSRLYSVSACVKYVVDTPEHIWGCLGDPDASMFLEAFGGYLRARQVHSLLLQSPDLNKFPLLKHQWEIVETFKNQISKHSRDRLSVQGLSLSSYADALATVTVIDEDSDRFLTT
jgi:conserved oligomeric Golgi complex subunit 1